MADETTASVIPLHQAPPKRKGKTGDKRAKVPRRANGKNQRGLALPMMLRLHLRSC